jgi:hypothetical protein
MSSTKDLPPGTPAPRSGEYTEIGPRGGRHEEVTVPRGHRLPPTEHGGTYTLTRPARNGSGDGKKR